MHVKVVKDQLKSKKKLDGLEARSLCCGDLSSEAKGMFSSFHLTNASHLT